MSDEFPAPHFFKTIKNKTDTCVLTIKTDLATAEKVVALVVEEHKLENGSSIA